MASLILSEYISVANVLLLLFFLFLFHQLVELYGLRDMPPGPRFPVLPVLGHALHFDVSAQDFTEATQSLCKKYGNVFSLKVGGYKTVVACTSAAVHEILVKRSEDYAGRRQTYSFRRLTLGGKGIVLGNYGPAWKFHRKLFVTVLRQYLSDNYRIEKRISHEAHGLLRLMESKEGSAFDPSDILAQVVASVICKITFGEEYDASHADMERLLMLNQKVASNVKDAQTIMMLDFFPITEYLPELPAYKRMFPLRDETFLLLQGLLDERKQGFDPSRPAQDLVSGLLRERSKAKDLTFEDKITLLSDDYLLNTMEDMFLAGYETTSTALRWIIAFLVNYPQYQGDIQRNLDQTVGRDRMPKLEDRSRLPIVQATIMEVLRLGNVAPQALPHFTLRETSLCGHRVPKDTVVIVDTQAVHLDPECWKDPTVFNPYRHIDSDGEIITNQANFYPFGAGRRVCAGESLAKLELFMFLAWMLHKFTFVPVNDGHPPKLKGYFGFTQHPESYKIRAIKR